MSNKNLNEWLFADIDDLIDCNYDEESVADIKMTYEEGKNIIDENNWKYNGNSITNETICKCRNKFRESLDKQIPEKPICEVLEIKSERQQSYIRYLKCPNCKRNIDEENTVHFCTYCGQAIDWSDEE